jgi:hypothetical protein
MAAEFASDNADQLRLRTGREPQLGDLYAAHFLGAAGAAQLINAAGERPWDSAAATFPQAARANRPVFYDGDGRPRSHAEVLAQLRATALREAPPVSRVEFAGSTAGGGNSFAGVETTNPALAAALEARAQAERQLMSLLAAQGEGSSQGGPFASLLTAGLVQQALGGATASGQPGLDPRAVAAYNAQLQAREDAALQEAAASLIEAGRSAGSIATALSPNGTNRGGNQGGGSSGQSAGADSGLFGLGSATEAATTPQPSASGLAASTVTSPGDGRLPAQAAMLLAATQSGVAAPALRGRSLR